MMNCYFSTHPRGTKLKLSKVHCCECGSELGDVLDATRMVGTWRDAFGSEVVQFRCEMVLLQLADCSNLVLEARKWSILAEAFGGQAITRLGGAMMRRLAP